MCSWRYTGETENRLVKKGRGFDSHGDQLGRSFSLPGVKHILHKFTAHVMFRIFRLFLRYGDTHDLLNPFVNILTYHHRYPTACMITLNFVSLVLLSHNQ